MSATADALAVDPASGDAPAHPGHRGIGAAWRPHGPLSRREWRYVASRTVTGFVRQRGIDLAAALTYFSCLALFPIALSLVSALALVSGHRDAETLVLGVLGAVVQPATVRAVRAPLDQLGAIPVPGLALAIGLVLTVWTVSAYATCFGRALNAFYEVQEGRVIWKFRGSMMLLALPLIVGGAVVAAIVLSSPPVTAAVLHAAGLGAPWPGVWLVVKWPLLVAVLAAMLGGLYYWTPNVKRQTVSPISWGALVAILGWALASAGFALYIAGVGHYDQVYGWLGGAVVLLLWLYLSNFVLVYGASLDTEVVRMHQLRDGVPSESVIQVPLRDTHRNLRLAARRSAAEADGRAIRLAATAEHDAEVRHERAG